MAQKECAVVYIMGQSNAHAHCQVMAEEDIIKEPMKNVWKLDTKDNQSYDVKNVKWSGFTSYDYNLGETQNCTYSMASFLAKKWQKRIDDGEALPDLHIVQISIGGQMIVGGMWEPNYSRAYAMRPGTWEVCEIALYEWSMFILPLIAKDLKERFDIVHSLGLNWIGGEGDTYPGSYDRKYFKELYEKVFRGLIEATGFDTPLYLYDIVRKKHMEQKNMSTEGIDAVNAEYRELQKIIPNCHIVNPHDAPNYHPSRLDDGLFMGDLSHYIKTTQEWFADNFLKLALKK